MTDPTLATAFSIRARAKSFAHALHGLLLLIRHEHNARVHLAATIAAIGLGVLLHISLTDWRWIVLAIAIVWTAEALNTAIEALCDRITLEFDPAIGRTKDLAAGAVLASSIASALIGAMTFAPYFLARAFP